MNKTKTGDIRRSNVRSRIYQPAAMLVHGIASMPAKNAGALMAVGGIKDAVPLIHGPAGCASLRKMNSFATSSPAPHTPCTDLSEIDLVLGGETKLYRGIIDLYNRLKPALIVVIPTCPSDIVCGGFGINLRQGFADQVILVTSSDYLSVFAANNICKGIYRYSDRNGTRLGGIIYNVRGLLDDISLVEEFADEIGSRIIGAVKSSYSITESEIYAQTVIEREPESGMAESYRTLARNVVDNTDQISPTPLTDEKLAELAQKIRERTRLKHEGEQV